MAAEPQRKPRGNRRAMMIATVTLSLVVLLALVAQLLFRRLLDTEHVARRLQAAITGLTDSLYQVHVGSARFDWIGRSFVLHDFRLIPDTAAFQRRRDRPVPRTRYAVSAASLRFEGIPLWPIFGKQFVARAAMLDSVRIAIRLDKTRPTNPKAVTRLPQYYVGVVGRPVRIGLLRLVRSAVEFSERHVDGTRFGTLPFDSLEATVTNLTNTRRGATQGRSIFDVRTLLAGAGPLVARFEYDLSEPRLNLSYTGSVSRMDARAFNSMLPDLEGLRIRSGGLDTAWFQVNVKDDVASGTLKLRYHDFEIETLDKRSGDRSLGDVFRTFIANTFKLHENNPSGDDPARTAVLRQARGELHLFKFIWLTLRGGLFRIVGLAEAEES